MNDCNSVRLSCTGFRLGGISVPTFTVHQTEFIALSIPTETLVSWDEVLAVFLGRVSHPAVRIYGNTTLLSHEAVEKEYGGKTGTVGEHICRHTGAEPFIVESMLAAESLNFTARMESQDVTNKFLMCFTEIRIKRPELIVLSTQGLDPAGIVKVTASVSMSLGDGCAIHALTRKTEALLISCGLEEYCDRYDRVVRCSVGR
jgi:hypothetical protein